MLFERAHFVKGHRSVQSRLAAEGRQEDQSSFRTSPAHLLFLANDYFFHAFRSDRLNIGAVGEFRIGHDGGRIGIHEHDAVTLLAQSFASLGAGVIKFASLADDDRTSANYQDGMNVGALRHKNKIAEN